MLKSMTVTMDRESWKTADAAMLEMAVKLADDGETDLARQLMNKIVPLFATAAASDRLDEQEAQVREHLGFPPVKKVANGTVRDAEGHTIPTRRASGSPIRRLK